MGRNGKRRESAHGSLQVGHQQRRGHAFSRHVGDTQSKRFLVQWKNVEIIASHQTGRLPGAGDFISRHLRNFARQKFFLNRFGFCDLPFLLLKMEDGFLPRPEFFQRPQARFAALAAQADLLLENFQQPRVGPRLLDKVAHAVLHGFHGQAHGGPSGHGHHRRSIFDLPQPAEHIQTFASGRRVARVVQINEKNIEFAARHRRQQVRRRIHRFDAVAVPLEQQPQRVQNVLLVVSDEDAGLHQLAFPFEIAGTLICNANWIALQISLRLILI